MLTERATQLALGIAAAIIAISIAAWLYSESLANTLLAAISAAATTATAIMVKELEIAVKQLRFEAVKEAYNNLDNKEFKDTVEKKICPWLKDNLDQIDWLSCNIHGDKKTQKAWEEAKQAARYASISLNKTGFLVYMDFIDPKPLAEELGGLILRSFACLRPLLVCMRNTSEPPSQPWFMRRFALLLALYTEHYLAKQWRLYLQETLQWRDALRLNIEAYSYCITQAGNTDKHRCLDYLPAAPSQVIEEINQVIHQEGGTERATNKLAQCIAARRCSLVWRNWLHEDILAKAKKLRVKPLPPAKEAHSRG